MSTHGLMPTHVLEGVWPIDERTDLSPRDLMNEALEDLPRLAREHAVVIAPSRARVCIRPGREVPGSRGAAIVVYAVVPAIAQRAVVDGTEDLPAPAAKPARIAAGDTITPVEPPPMPPLRDLVAAREDDDETLDEKERVRRLYARSEAAKHDPDLTLAA